MIMATIVDEQPGIVRPAVDPDALPPWTGALRPLVDVVASIRAGVHTKLLAGFLAGVVLIAGMGLLSWMVIGRMSAQVATLTTVQQKVVASREMKYAVTSQSHFRAMALLTRDESNNQKIADAKATFVAKLNEVMGMSAPTAQNQEFFNRVQDADRRFDQYSNEVLALYQAGKIDDALKLHLSAEHPVSHELEAAMQELERNSGAEMAAARANFEADGQLLTTMVIVFSIISIVLALLLGFVMSWAFIRPVRKIDHALAGIAAGKFDTRVNVPNRDEFGTLTRNLNTMSAQLANLYESLHTLNADLQNKVQEQLREIERAMALRRYLSPQLAESILAGKIDVNPVTRRKTLTIFFSDVRGFTPMSERVEPEELVERLNQYLTEMTEIVFKHGGTLDKYIGDAIMVFFGDPIPYEDHAERAVKMALEMREKLAELQRRWAEDAVEGLAVGMGISTGYVTVGNIGSPTRVDYTVLGNHVNLASRLANTAEAGQILISATTLAAVRDLVDATEVDEMELEGVSRPVKIYAVRERTAA
jgi:class 3 adenylate cyclase/HAMP domain-containing protein